MQIGLEGLIILSSIILVTYFIYTTFFDDNIEPVVSSLDDREYYVQADKEDAKDAANTIAEIRRRVVLLVEHLIKTHSADDERIIMLKDNFNPDAFKEGVDNSGYTSYSVNKGEQIILCLRNKNKLMDINTLIFVTLHELAHLITPDIGHTPLFWDNFKWILEEAMNIGIYVKQEFDKKPVEYCGMLITSNPLDR
jgi:hypothetical protein